jgi:hypothetical protein
MLVPEDLHLIDVKTEDSDACESTMTSDYRKVFIAHSSLIRAVLHQMALAILDSKLGDC